MDQVLLILPLQVVIMVLIQFFLQLHLLVVEELEQAHQVHLQMDNQEVQVEVEMVVMDNLNILVVLVVVTHLLFPHHKENQEDQIVLMEIQLQVVAVEF